MLHFTLPCFIAPNGCFSDLHSRPPFVPVAVPRWMLEPYLGRNDRERRTWLEAIAICFRRW